MAATRVLVTGGAGFIGSHLVRAWVARGAHVRVVDSLRTGKRENLDGVPCEFLHGTIEDAALMARAVEGVDFVHHLAAQVSVPESMENPQEAEAINVGGTLRVLDAVRRAGVARRVVLSSTCAIYGQAERPEHREDHLPDPCSPYAITKLAAEGYTRLYLRAHGVPTVTLRYFNVYGPRQDPRSAYAAAIPVFLERALRGAPITIFGDGLQSRDFVHVQDVVAANLLVAETPGDGGIYNVGTGVRTTVRQLAETIMTLVGSAAPLHFAAVRAGDVRHSCADASRLRRLGWEPTVCLEEGLRGMLPR